ncbi:hypothetical protein DL764_008285 [Monosporascus ibericus]|uniref:GST C-terminal domain-containing protein n=1 Tax=Monosporascus ibericus TaxID=155417 RepID=A0A4Q4SXW5_9PEZI|nr:hypothetical protein DL764_008285 [Monosporascus ibericus]
MEQPFGTLYILAAAKLNGLKLELPPFEYGVTTKTPEYRAKFPRGKAPAFESASGGFRLAESGAIAHYVSASGPRAAQLLGSSPEDQGRIHEWIYWNELELGPVLIDLIQWRLGTASYESTKEEAAAVALQEHLAHLEETLKGRTWLVDDQSCPSLADLTVGSAILFACRFYIDREMREGIPHTMVYLQRLREVDGLEELFTINMIEKRKQP